MILPLHQMCTLHITVINRVKRARKQRAKHPQSRCYICLFRCLVSIQSNCVPLLRLLLPSMRRVVVLVCTALIQDASCTDMYIVYALCFAMSTFSITFGNVYIDVCLCVYSLLLPEVRNNNEKPISKQKWPEVLAHTLCNFLN